jgi:membrane protein DedA with SNARE-associated domain
MDLANEPIFAYLAQFAYEPGIVYSLIIGFMIASSFGFPIPEEVTLISAGFITHMSLHPDIFPPPAAGATSVDPVTTAIVCFASVFLSDFLVFMLGRKYGSRMLRSKLFERYRNSLTMRKVEVFTEKYGALACGIFRFTPGLRFPGHFACGSMKIPVWKFITVDGLAALLTVPTQVLLIAYYGEIMFEFLKEFKIVVFSLLACVLIFYIVRKFVFTKNQAPELNKQQP